MECRFPHPTQRNCKCPRPCKCCRQAACRIRRVALAVSGARFPHPTPSLPAFEASSARTGAGHLRTRPPECGTRQPGHRIRRRRMRDDQPDFPHPACRFQQRAILIRESAMHLRRPPTSLQQWRNRVICRRRHASLLITPSAESTYGSETRRRDPNRLAVSFRCDAQPRHDAVGS